MAKREAIAAKRYATLMAAYQNVFRSTEGEIVLKDLMKTHGILSNIYKGDINDMLIKEGERNVVLRLLSILDIDIDAIYERIDRETKDVE